MINQQTHVETPKAPSLMRPWHTTLQNSVTGFLQETSPRDLADSSRCMFLHNYCTQMLWSTLFLLVLQQPQVWQRSTSGRTEKAAAILIGRLHVFPGVPHLHFFLTCLACNAMIIITINNIIIIKMIIIIIQPHYKYTTAVQIYNRSTNMNYFIIYFTSLHSTGKWTFISLLISLHTVV